MELLIEAEAPPLTQWDDGSIRVANSRVPLERVVCAYNSGDTPEEIRQDFESLSLTDVYRAVAYYLGHKTVVDNYMKTRMAEATRNFESHPDSNDTNGIRERLLNRHSKENSNCAPRS
ncbi:MAG: DUF433 domain-containing protein [Planctomycetota bacterium]